MHSGEVNSAGELFMFSLVGSWLTAVAYVVVAFGRTPFQDPFVFPIMAVGAMFFTLLTFPFAVLFLRHVEFARSAAVVLATSLITTIVAAPFLHGLAVPLAFLATVDAMAFCWGRFPRSEGEASN
jgi:hypothetical protein